jgi:hypothetical protein
MLSIVDDTSKSIVKDALDLYNSIEKGQADFALESLGESFC